MAVVNKSESTPPSAQPPAPAGGHRVGTRTIGGRTVDFDARAQVMAVVNRTADSFSDRGRTFELEAAIQACRQAAAQGADWVDIGGLPFSPDADRVSPAEEIDRVVPLIEAVAQPLGMVVSVDTTRPEVARAAVECGAAVINDTSGLRDPALAEVAADTGAALVITHSLAAPGVHHRRPHYDDVVTEVVAFLTARVERARHLGVDDGQIIVDPGPDLNKNTRHTLEVMRNFHRFVALGFPTLAAVSHKDFIGEALDLPVDRRTTGSIVAATWCLQQGARIIRAHDVAPTVQAVRLAAAMAGTRPPAYQRHNM